MFKESFQNIFLIRPYTPEPTVSLNSVFLGYSSAHPCSPDYSPLTEAAEDILH